MPAAVNPTRPGASPTRPTDSRQEAGSLGDGRGWNRPSIAGRIGLAMKTAKTFKSPPMANLKLGCASAFVDRRFGLGLGQDGLAYPTKVADRRIHLLAGS